MQLPVCFCMRFVLQGKRRWPALQPEWPFLQNNAVLAAAPAFQLSRTINACMNSHRRASELCPALERERPVGENRVVPAAAAAYHRSGNESACNYRGFFACTLRLKTVGLKTWLQQLKC